ncbi:ACP S-malonyltransferase [Cellulosilyticum sp. I15G10I2]|uniref:ACP S-malonyltransferase n=1 Tax=Cellulosilyticum sp. I15G10I2 TaxID=1892843 RepID=UPI0009429A4E|nr:ACP S-malonyltransferase [Cellulosilyticum sp. I15G10I2]
MKTAILFPGQGAQSIGMGKNLYDNYSESKRIFDAAADILDWDIKEVCFEDSQGIINQTRYTQAALFTTNVAAYEALKAKGFKADAVLGFSLGEYSAIMAGGALGFEETLKLVEKRAGYMETCAKAHPGGMVAVIGLEIDKIDEVCKKVTKEIGPAEIANDNCPGQVTLSGTKEALEAAMPYLKEAGAKRVLPLQVSGAFHSSLMKDAADALQAEIEHITFNEVNIPIISNVTADYMNKNQIIANIPLQVVKGVRFRESILHLIGEGFDTFIEVGPKRTLCNLVKKISGDVRVLNVEDQASLENVIEIIGGKVC